MRYQESREDIAARVKERAAQKDKRLARLKAAAKKVQARQLDKTAVAKGLAKQPLAKGKPEPKGKPGRREKLTARERALVKEFELRELSPADAEARRTRLKNLIVLGKERAAHAAQKDKRLARLKAGGSGDLRQAS